MTEIIKNPIEPPRIPMDREMAKKDLLDVKRVLDSKGVQFFLGYGVVLGIVREKDFIKFDDDIDIIIIQKLTYRQRKEIAWALWDIGFTSPDDVVWNVYGRYEMSEGGYNGTEITGIIPCKRNVPVSIMFYYDNGEEWLCIPKKGGIPVLAVPYKFLEKGEWVKFKGEKFLIPSPKIEYLEFLYGKDWKTPKEGEHAKQYWQIHDKKALMEKYFEL
jgi:hypothetical protein